MMSIIQLCNEQGSLVQMPTFQGILLNVLWNKLSKPQNSHLDSIIFTNIYKVCVLFSTFFKSIACFFHFYYQQIFSLLMQPTNPVDPRPNYSNNRQRPLQKSLFLPDHYSPQNQNTPKTIPMIPDFLYNPMKRSSTTIGQNGSSMSINSSQYGTNYNFNTNSNPSSATLIPPSSFDQRAQSQHELLHHPGTSSLKNLNTMVRSNVISQADNKNFYKQKRQNFDLKINTNPVSQESVDIQLIINEVTLQIKEKHLPNMIKSIKKELYDDLHHFRVQFQTFKDEVKAHQAQSQQMVNWFKANEKNMDNVNKKDHYGTKTPKSPKKDKQYEVQWIEAQFFALQQRLNQYQTKVYDSINLLNSKFEDEFKQKIPKSSSIKSSFPPFSLQYRQIFTVSNSQKSFPELTISQSTYYIDKQGFLLDQENRYLLDTRGNQIKMQDKHLRLLQQHKILGK